MRYHTTKDNDSGKMGNKIKLYNCPQLTALKDFSDNKAVLRR